MNYIKIDSESYALSQFNSFDSFKDDCVKIKYQKINFLHI